MYFDQMINSCDRRKGWNWVPFCVSPNKKDTRGKQSIGAVFELTLDYKGLVENESAKWRQQNQLTCWELVCEHVSPEAENYCQDRGADHNSNHSFAYLSTVLPLSAVPFFCAVQGRGAQVACCHKSCHVYLYFLSFQSEILSSAVQNTDQGFLPVAVLFSWSARWKWSKYCLHHCISVDEDKGFCLSQFSFLFHLMK